MTYFAWQLPRAPGVEPVAVEAVTAREAAELAAVEINKLQPLKTPTKIAVLLGAGPATEWDIELRRPEPKFVATAIYKEDKKRPKRRKDGAA